MKPSPAADHARKKLRQELYEALNSLYMGDCKFVPAFDETPVQAIAAFRKAPETFGRLRTYIGRTTLQNHKRRVVRLAKALLALACDENATSHM